MRSLCIAIMLSAICWICAGCQGLGVTLVENGQPMATIITARDAPATVEFAVAELQHHLEKITGARLARASDDQKVSGNVVLVGESRLTRELGLKSSEFKRREYLVQTHPGVLVLMGRDRQVSGKLRYDDRLSRADKLRRNFPLWPGWTRWDEIGTAFAVYHFLERECGVRWYLPTDYGTFIPKKPSMTASGLNVRRSPAMDYVEGKYKPVPKRLYWWNRNEAINYGDFAPFRDSQLWHLRNKMWGEPFACNHSFGSWPERFMKKHPDWFSKGYEGVTRNRQLCFTNPEVIQQMIKDARDYFDGKKVPGLFGQGDMVAIVPMDNRSYCKCARCQAEMDPLPKGVKPVDGFNSGISSRHVFNFAIKVADAVAESHPGKRIGVLAYAGYFDVPKTMTRKRDNLDVMVCVQSDSWQYRPDVREYCEKEFKKWGKYAGRLYLWIYHCFPQYGKGNKFPGMIFGEYARQMRFYRKLGVRGVFNDMDGKLYALTDAKGKSGPKISVWPNPFEDLFSWYAVVKLADDPTLDENKMYDELYQNWFGASAPAIKAFVNHSRKIYNDPTRVRANGRYWRAHFDVAWDVVCTNADMEILARHMATAHKLADSHKVRRRVKLFDGAVWQCIQAGRALWDKQYNRKANQVLLERAKGTPGSLKGRNWKRAAKLTSFVTPFGHPLKKRPDEAIQKTGAPSVFSPATDVKVMYDAKYIYLHITCHDPDTTQLMRKGVKHDSKTFLDDAVEIFFDPGRTKIHYRQIVVNANGAVFDSKDKDTTWNSDAKVVAKIYPKKWVLQIAVPIASMADKPPKPGEEWGFNVCRDFRARTLTTWSPTFAGWRFPDRFGIIKFK